MLSKFIFLILLKIFSINSFCIEGENHCLKCHPLTKLCYKCELDIFIPDEEGGCHNIQKCVIGENYCVECNEEGYLCQKCAEGYYSDNSGGCSYTDNCEISYKGNCLKCKNNFILVGEKNEGLTICKSLDFDDLKYCETVNISNGLCKKCKEGYYLNKGDNKCTSIKNCFESIFDICKKCNNGYYLSKKENKCLNQIDNFEHCMQTLEGKTCEICDDDYYFDDDGLCVNTNHWEKREKADKCDKCISGYYLSKDNFCINTEGCKTGDKDIGICIECNDNYYIDYKDGKCKSNQEDNEFKYCKISKNEECLKCIDKYYLGDDNKCSNTPNCSESNNGICLNCADNYYLISSNICINVEHCFRSEDFRCVECEDIYYFSFKDNKCLIAEGKFENCKYSVNNCLICKDDYYLNQSDFTCYSNTEDNKYYKCILVDTSGNCIVCMKGYNLNAESHRCSKINN